MSLTINDQSRTEPLDRSQVGSRWYVINSLPRREFRAERQLRNQRFDVFLPRRLKTVRHARKLTNVVAPFFPRYLFVELDLTRHPWRSINGTFGVAGLLMQGEVPQPVPRGVVEAMAGSVDARGLMSMEKALRVGSEVRIAAGPFAEQLGVLDRLDDAGRVRVLLKIMGGTVPVRLAHELLLPAG
ncbi:transcription termination/antitermination protein NusG [Bradyrhizobium sp. ORS 111]|uniref:transcription termination/antitermination protein NusG n=1 Tax=Bradyrhizobium sp. ORS 111 TaxID=1685958 RepID=UPI00388F8335